MSLGMRCLVSPIQISVKLTHTGQLMVVCTRLLHETPWVLVFGVVRHGTFHDVGHVFYRNTPGETKPLHISDVGDVL